MKKVNKADRVLMVTELDGFIDKQDFESLVVVAEAGAKVTLSGADNAEGTNAEVVQEVQLAEDQTQADVLLEGALQFIKVEGAKAVIFGDKRNVEKVYGLEPLNRLFPHIEKDKNWRA